MFSLKTVRYEMIVVDGREWLKKINYFWRTRLWYTLTLYPVEDKKWIIQWRFEIVWERLFFLYKRLCLSTFFRFFFRGVFTKDHKWKTTTQDYMLIQSKLLRPNINIGNFLVETGPIKNPKNKYSKANGFSPILGFIRFCALYVFLVTACVL